jgi:hypothetical protein
MVPAFSPEKFYGRPGQRPKVGHTFSLPAPVSAAGDREMVIAGSMKEVR